MKFETVEIEDLGKVSGTVPATLHYHEDQQVHLKIIADESPSGVDVLVNQLKGLCREYLDSIDKQKEFSNNAYQNMNVKAADMWRHKSDGLIRAERDIRALLAQYNAVKPEKDQDEGFVQAFKKMIADMENKRFREEIIVDEVKKWLNDPKTLLKIFPQSLQTPIDRKPEEKWTMKEITEFINWCGHLAWFDNDTQLWNTHDESLDPFRYTTDEMRQEYISCDKDSEKFENKHSRK